MNRKIVHGGNLLMTKECVNNVVVLTANDETMIPNEGFWTLAYNHKGAEAFCKNLFHKKIIEKCSYINTRDGKITLIRFYLNGKDKSAHQRLFAYLLRHKYIRKIHNKRYPNMLFEFLNSDKSLFLEDLLDLDTGEFK